jgi:PIN domain nuclease of toxin-antitoxin system
MDLLLDTNALLWALSGNERLGQASETIEDRRNRVFVSAVSAWEIAIKVGLGKLNVPPGVSSWLPSELVSAQFTVLPISLIHALTVETLPNHHADPFDRLLIAQATCETLVIVTGDAHFESYNVQLIRC